MDLSQSGIDCFYIDESVRTPLSVVSAVRIPFLRPKAQGGWEFVWERYLDAATKWRRELSKKHSVRFREELHANKILGRQNFYHKTWRNLTHTEAFDFYSDALATLTWLPDRSIMTTYATDTSSLMGHTGIFACMFSMFQRMRTHCSRSQVNGLAFFDEGHESYIHLYRKARKYMPTGSAVGFWPGGSVTRNMPLDMFPKDGNTKSSKLSYFVQTADLICYSARLKLEYERGSMTAKRVGRNHHLIYDHVHQAALNKRVTIRRSDAIAPT